jgi:hypothetical protein
VGQAALEAMVEGPIPDDAEARQLAGLLLAGEARLARLRERLRQYFQDREPLAFNGIELGFFPTKGRYDAAAVFRAATDAGADPWPLLAVDGRTLVAFLKHRPGVEQSLASAWTPSPAWFGHRKAKNATRGARDPDHACPAGAPVPGIELCSGDRPWTS